MVMQVEAKTLADQVRVARASRHWSQSILAMIAKVSQGQVSRIERSLPVDAREKAKVLKVLDIPEDNNSSEK